MKKILVSITLACLTLIGCSNKDAANDESKFKETPVENKPKDEEPKDEPSNEEKPDKEAPKAEPPRETPGGERKPPIGKGDGTPPSTPITPTPIVPGGGQTPANTLSKFDKEGIIMLMEEYLYNFPKAVNEGAFIYIMHLIDPDSDFYNEQVEFVLDVYERNIKETLINYQIGEITVIDSTTYQITIKESYSIYYGNENREAVKNFNNTYTVKKDKYNVFLIIDLVVSEI